MEAFFNAVSDYADAKGYDVVFIRDFDEDDKDGLTAPTMWAAFSFRDGQGAYTVNVKRMLPMKGRKANKKLNFKASEPESADAFKSRVIEKIERRHREVTKERRFAKPIEVKPGVNYFGQLVA